MYSARANHEKRNRDDKYLVFMVLYPKEVNLTYKAITVRNVYKSSLRPPKFNVNNLFSHICSNGCLFNLF